MGRPPRTKSHDDVGCTTTAHGTTNTHGHLALPAAVPCRANRIVRYKWRPIQVNYSKIKRSKIALLTPEIINYFPGQALFILIASTVISDTRATDRLIQRPPPGARQGKSHRHGASKQRRIQGTRSTRFKPTSDLGPGGPGIGSDRSLSCDIPSDHKLGGTGWICFSRHSSCGSRLVFWNECRDHRRLTGYWFEHLPPCNIRGT
jgi:hypothetical protein